MRTSNILAVAASGITAVNAVAQGFNYGSTQTDGSIKQQVDFENEFKTAKNLVGTNGGFTSARIYTTIQAGTANDPISAIPAAIAQQTTLLLGIWASGGQAGVDNEIIALKAAIQKYGTAFTSIVTGLSIGSEDLYRDSGLGQENKAGIGTGPDTIVKYIKQVRAALVGTPLSGVKIGHVDTWTAWVNGTNAEVIANIDWLGFDGYPYFESTHPNGIELGKANFYESFGKTVAVSGGKDVWITETGWPVSGNTVGQAVPSLQNAKTYWDAVGCPSFGIVNTYWFTLQDSYPTTPNPSFGVVGSTLTTTPLYDLSCASVASSSSSSTSASSSTSSASSSASTSASSASSASSATTISGGGGLSPTQGNGVGSSALSIATGSATSSNSATTVTSGPRSTATVITTASGSTPGAGGSGSRTTTSPTTSPTGFAGAAAANSGSAVGGLVAAFAAVLAAL